MTKLLKKAIDRVSGLPDDEQDAIAGIILDELEDEVRWRGAFASSQDALARLAGEAKQEIVEGNVEPFDPATKPE
ncbi:MAG: hypothetical protein HQ512_04210 [Rhodospirillales bacterium]|nr:hypothetical protein [Rhodospirillales bacterium]